MPTTLIVEANPRGHRFQSVSWIAEAAGRTGDVLLLTSRGAKADPAFAEYLGEVDLRVEEVFPGPVPDGRTAAEAVAAVCRHEQVELVVVLEADQILKRWWWAAPRALRGVRPRPRVVFMLTRYPARVRPTDWPSWRLRLPKAALAAASRANRSVHRVGGYAGRDDAAAGWLVKRVRDPDVCSAHARDRAALRERLGLPADRRLAGIFGVVTARKNAPMIWEAITGRGLDVDLLLAGKLDDDVAAWVASLPPQERERVVVRDDYHPSDVLDAYVAAVDVVPLAMTNNAPSGIMGKALAAGVPVVTAGAEVMARELRATNGGEVAEFDPVSIGAAIERVLDGTRAHDGGGVALATPEEYVARLLG